MDRTQTANFGTLIECLKAQDRIEMALKQEDMQKQVTFTLAPKVEVKAMTIKGGE